MAELLFPIREYDLAGTLACGQAFRWEPRGNPEAPETPWVGVADGRWVKLTFHPGKNRGEGILRAVTAGDEDCELWLRHYLQIDADLPAILSTFPDDEPMREAVSCCRGLRLLRQDPWECLASFICSASKQIMQIRAIVARLSQRFGDPVKVPPGEPPAWAFPTADQIASAGEGRLRECGMGFRAPNLWATAGMVSSGRLDLDGLSALSLAEAREKLVALPGVGPKIADCVLLFGCGFHQAFPLDVWILRVLREIYFQRRRPTPARLRRFAATYFGPYGGHAQQYLFHAARQKAGRRSA